MALFPEAAPDLLHWPLETFSSSPGQQLHLPDAWQKHHLAYRNAVLQCVGLRVCSWGRWCYCALWDWIGRQQMGTWYSLTHCQGHAQHFAITNPSTGLELKQWCKHFHINLVLPAAAGGHKTKQCFSNMFLSLLAIISLTLCTDNILGGIFLNVCQWSVTSTGFTKKK